MYYLFNQNKNNLASNNVNKINWPSLTQKKDLIKPNCPQTEPYTTGTNDCDNFILGSIEKGTIVGNDGDDTFDYQDDLGNQNTRLVGGLGNDVLSFSKLTVDQALDKLKSDQYSFVARQNGFILRTKDNQEIQISAENIKFSDKCFNLQNSTDLKCFIDALANKCIPIVNETDKPVFSKYLSETQTPLINSQRQNNRNWTLEQAYLTGLGYAVLNKLNPNENINQANLSGLTLNSLIPQNQNIDNVLNPSLGTEDLNLSNSFNTFNFLGLSQSNSGGLTGNNLYY